MEISDWLPSVVALVVGIGSVFISNRYIDKRENTKAQQQRAESMTNYAHALLEWNLFYTSYLGYGSGAHPSPSSDRLEETARKFYPYLHEFEGHQEYGNLMSPYPELMPGDPDFRTEAAFYGNAYDALKEHLIKYPRVPKKLPYKK